MTRSSESDIARRVKVMEWSKAELLDAVSRLFRATIHGKEEPILDSLGTVLLAAYLLAPRLGINYARLDLQLEALVRHHLEQGHPVEDWYSDLSNLLKYLDGRGRSFD